MAAIKILHLSYHHLLALAFTKGLETLTRKIEVHIVLIERGLSSILTAASNIRPDVILVPSGFPYSNLAFVQQLREAGCQTPVLVVCSRYALPVYEDLLEGQVQGIISTSATLEELEAAIYAVTDKQPDSLQQLYLQATRNPHRTDLKEGLSDRELEVLGLAAIGLSDKEIAARLEVSFKTVNNYMRSIFEKLQANNRCAAITKAFAKGMLYPQTLLSPDELM